MIIYSANSSFLHSHSIHFNNEMLKKNKILKLNFQILNYFCENIHHLTLIQKYFELF